MFGLLLAIIYLIFISLGLPDALLGASWPAMYIEFDVPISYCGVISFLIVLCTVFSSLLSERITKKFGTGVVCAFSIMLTCLGLFGFSSSKNFYMLLIWTVPYGFGAGAIDAAINNYVAVNYESRHMSWLHSMWGLGASIGPYVMGYALTYNANWHDGYLMLMFVQIGICAIAFLSLPLWKKNKKDVTIDKTFVSLKEVLKLKHIFKLFICLFCYCALEQTAILWGSSYLVLNNDISKEMAANFASFILIGITVGRIGNGFLAYRLNDKVLIRLGLGVITIGIIMLIVPINVLTLVGFMLIGLGCAPIYPCIMHLVPVRFGTKYSQSIIGVQMAFAYLGICLMPPLFGVIAEFISIALLPLYLAVLLGVLVVMHERLVRTK